MKKKSRLKLGIIGCGFVAQHCHLPALRLISNIQITALADTDSATLNQVADRYSIEKRYCDYRVMLREDDCDLVAVLAPPRFHCDMGTAVLAANKHLLLEKPTALSLEEADRLVDQASKSEATAVAGFNLRWHRLIQEARGLVASGRLGEIVGMRTVFSTNRASSTASPNWRRQNNAGGDVLFDLGIHHFDLWRFLLQREVKEVFAQRHRDEYGTESMTVMGSMEDGTLVNSFLSHRGANVQEVELWGTDMLLSLSCYRFDSLRLYSRNEPQGALRSWVKGVAASLLNAPRGAEQLIRGSDTLVSYRSEWRNFADTICSGAAVQCSLEDARKTVSVTVAAAQSALEGHPVRVEDAGSTCEGAADRVSPG